MDDAPMEEKPKLGIKDVIGAVLAAMAFGVMTLLFAIMSTFTRKKPDDAEGDE